jgi:hypothetical protein
MDKREWRHLLPEDLNVGKGYYVSVGQVLSSGSVHPLLSYRWRQAGLEGYGSDGLLNPTKELVTEVRYQIGSFLFTQFANNAVKVLGRHFELPAYSQTSHGLCLGSENGEFEAGALYPVSKLVKATNVVWSFEIVENYQAILRGSGVAPAIAFQSAFNMMGDAFKGGKWWKTNSTLGLILTGSPLSEPLSKMKRIAKNFTGEEVEEFTVTKTTKNDWESFLQSESVEEVPSPKIEIVKQKESVLDYKIASYEDYLDEDDLLEEEEEENKRESLSEPLVEPQTGNVDINKDVKKMSLFG